MPTHDFAAEIRGCAAARGRVEGDATTDRQEVLLAFVEAFAAEHGYPPTVREIGAGLGFRSTNAVADYLKSLRRKGRVTWIDGKVRTLRVIEAVES